MASGRRALGWLRVWIVRAAGRHGINQASTYARNDDQSGSRSLGLGLHCSIQRVGDIRALYVAGIEILVRFASDSLIPGLRSDNAGLEHTSWRSLGADWFNNKGEPKMPGIRFRITAMALAACA